MPTAEKILQDIVDSATWIREKYGPPTFLRMSLLTWLELKRLVDEQPRFRDRELKDLLTAPPTGARVLGMDVEIDTSLDPGVIEIVHRMKVQEIADARS